MRNYWGAGSRALALAALIAAVAGGSAQAATPFTPTSACSSPGYAISQPYLSWRDVNWYTLAPGQAADSFDGNGWVLSGGASLVTTTLADGSTGTVLDLPAGSTAVSPPMCVDSEYPTARVDVRDVAGPPGVRVLVAYTGTKSWGNPAAAGGVPADSSWSVSPPIQLHPGNLFGWQEAQYTFEGGARGSDAQLYDFYVDPRCRL